MNAVQSDYLSRFQTRRDLGRKILEAFARQPQTDLNDLVMVAAMFDLHVNDISHALATRYHTVPVTLALAS